MISAGAVACRSSHVSKPRWASAAAVRIHEAVVPVPDGHRIAERADDRVKAPLAAVQGAPQLLQQPAVLLLALLALGDVRDKGVKGPLPSVAKGRDRHLGGELRPVRTQPGDLDAPVEHRPLSGGQETSQSHRGGQSESARARSDRRPRAQPRARAQTPNIVSAAGVPVGHHAALIHGDHGAVSPVEDQLGQVGAHPRALSTLPAGGATRPVRVKTMSQTVAALMLPASPG